MMNFKVEDVGNSREEVVNKLRALDRDRSVLQRDILKRFAETVIRISVDKYMSAGAGDAEHLHSRSGKLSSSLRYWITGDDAYVGTNMVYAAIHEYGGKIRPVVAKMLSWMNGDGGRVFAKEVAMPARPYLRPAINDLFEEGRADRIAELTIQEHIRQKGLD